MNHGILAMVAGGYRDALFVGGLDIGAEISAVDSAVLPSLPTTRPLPPFRAIHATNADLRARSVEGKRYVALEYI